MTSNGLLDALENCNMVVQHGSVKALHYPGPFINVCDLLLNILCYKVGESKKTITEIPRTR